MGHPGALLDLIILFSIDLLTKTHTRPMNKRPDTGMFRRLN
jgi:hypothetical protein